MKNRVVVACVGIIPTDTICNILGIVPEKYEKTTDDQKEKLGRALRNALNFADIEPSEITEEEKVVIRSTTTIQERLTPFL